MRTQKVDMSTLDELVVQLKTFHSTLQVHLSVFISFNRRIADTTMKRSARRFSKKIPLSVRSSRQNTAIRMLNDLEAELRYLLNPQIASWRIFEYLLLIRKALSGDLHPRLGKVLRQRRAGKRERGKSLSHRSPLAPRRSW
jgi:hypothetical protein